MPQLYCESLSKNGGGGIRTHEGLRPAGFQDRSHQPLDPPSQSFAATIVPLVGARASGLSVGDAASVPIWKKGSWQLPLQKEPLAGDAHSEIYSTSVYVHVNLLGGAEANKTEREEKVRSNRKGKSAAIARYSRTRRVLEPGEPI